MHRISSMIISTLAASGLWLMSAAGEMEGAGGSGRMKNVLCYTPAPAAEAMAQEIAVQGPLLPALSLPEMELGQEADRAFEPAPRDNVQETTIEGGMSIKNETGYFVDAGELMKAGPELSLPAGEPQILIIHTHSSEAYTQAGLEVIHDRGIYDYPSYTGSYSRSGAAVQQYLDSYPGIRIVLDIHRDALGSEGVVYKTMAEEEGVCASQLMLLVGSDDSGLEHPDWRRNMALALYLQNAAVQSNPTLMRPISLVRERYNQHLSPGSLIIEVGSNGNTLQEALAGVRLFGRAIAPALSELVE